MPDSMEKGARPSQEASFAPKHCTACGTAVKDYLGPPQRCLMGLVSALNEWIDVLEQQNACKDEELCREQEFHLERQNALLATIGVLEERIVQLETIFSTLKDTCDSQCFHVG